MAHRERILNSERTVLRKDFTWLLEASNQRQVELLSRLINHHKMSIDTGPINKEGSYLTTVHTLKYVLISYSFLIYSAYCFNPIFQETLCSTTPHGNATTR